MDKLLNIMTEGIQTDGKDSYDYHRYEPTPYELLEQFFDEWEIDRKDSFVDYGCGKGRLAFYIHHRFHCHVSGIEYTEWLYKDALKNKERYRGAHKDDIQFYLIDASSYKVKPADNQFYFFNPFSIRIFEKVMNQIMYSLEQHPRKASLLLYYPDDKCIWYLDNHTSFTRVKDIPVKEEYSKALYPKHPSIREYRKVLAVYQNTI